MYTLLNTFTITAFKHLQTPISQGSSAVVMPFILKASPNCPISWLLNSLSLSNKSFFGQPNIISQHLNKSFRQMFTINHCCHIVSCKQICNYQKIALTFKSTATFFMNFDAMGRNMKNLVGNLFEFGTGVAFISLRIYSLF